MKLPKGKFAAIPEDSFEFAKVKGNYVVVYFYPKDMTSGCTKQAEDFQASLKDFKKKKAVIVGVSPDPIKSHDKFREKYSLEYALISDTDHKLCEHFKVWKEKSMYGREYMGVERSTFLFDLTDGSLLKEWRKVKVPGHVEEVLDSIGK